MHRFSALLFLGLVSLAQVDPLRAQPAVVVEAVVAEKSPEPEVGYQTVLDVFYRESLSSDDYARERCHLDLYYPTHVEQFPTVVWFHGGGLTGGGRSVPQRLREKGIAVVAVDYRLGPKVKAPVYIEDAAAAVAWTFDNIAQYGGSPERIFVSGHSAGGYLTSMVGLDKQWLSAHDIDADQLAGLIPFSGQVITHFTVRKEQGIGANQPTIDRFAPLFHVRSDSPPMLIISGDRELEMRGRYEENAYFWRMMQVVGHPDTRLLELDGYDHSGMADPAYPLLLKFISRISKES
ncbi:alpha/beta hydrolase [Aureliella helgolandensis]|uniref:Carboxylesterase NlhH n=1 Tax=Aureliella helgolandensis TaxID=2527968 RepID=A0A518G7K8_9BACT|nr:alpha/beta hydrolase [Aureliella helgolandensis]QDV24577.1 Carboxylesterase NlhH [Aureliella helgolandensis]